MIRCKEQHNEIIPSRNIDQIQNILICLEALYGSTIINKYSKENALRTNCL